MIHRNLQFRVPSFVGADMILPTAVARKLLLQSNPKRVPRSRGVHRKMGQRLKIRVDNRHFLCPPSPISEIEVSFRGMVRGGTDL